MGQGAPLGGQPAPRTASGTAANVLPWGVAFLALLALVAAFAGKNFGAAKGSSVGGSSNSLPTSAIDGPAAAQAQGAGPAPNIAAMSPGEQASRLYIRAMTAAEQGKVDSASFFATMAIAAHEMIPDITPDERYHLGRTAEILGDAALMRAQADTILSQRPTSLLGLILASRAAMASGDSSAMRNFNARLLKVADSELATGQIEYEQHRVEIDDAVAAAKRGGR